MPVVKQVGHRDPRGHRLARDLLRLPDDRDGGDHRDDDAERSAVGRPGRHRATAAAGFGAVTT